MEYVYHVLYHPEPEGGYTVIVPSLPGCVTYGKTLRQAQAMAQEAISLYVASLKARREPVPDDEMTLSSSVRIRAPRRRHLRYASKTAAKVA